MAEVRVGVLFGGRSSEHAISCVSAAGVMRALDPRRYTVVPIGIARDGRWIHYGRRLERDGFEQLEIREGRLPEVDGTAPESDPLAALAGVDVVFPVLHGPWGEDGTVQGLLEVAGLPYVGSGVLASAATMDKGAMKALLEHAGLPVGAYAVITDRQWHSEREAALRRLEALGLPVFVKPARAGSSLGIARVADQGALIGALEAAREHDPRVIVEAGFANVREIECGVLADRDGAPMASRCAEIVVGKGHDFYDFEAKYLDDAAELIVPAELDPEVEDEIRRLAIAAFDALGCEGLARVDFFLDDSGRIWINEANTMPGFTPISMFPRMWQAAGIGYSELVDRLIADAMRRGTGLR